MFNWTRQMFYLYKTNVLPVQDKCSDYTMLSFVKDFNQFWITFFCVLSSKDCTLSRYTFLYHTLILCTLFNSHMTIWILIPLMMFERKFCFSIFHYFLNQTNENMVDLHMVTHWVGYMEFELLYKVFTLSVHDKYTNCTRVYKTIICEGF